jgi:hypothetical protein
MPSVAVELVVAANLHLLSRFAVKAALMTNTSSDSRL